MEQLGENFNETGWVETKAELEEKRKKRGECLRCGRKCYKKKLFKKVPINDYGRVLNGRCLACKPLAAADGMIAEVTAAPADPVEF